MVASPKDSTGSFGHRGIPFNILMPSATRRLAVHRSIGSVDPVAISPLRSPQDLVVKMVSIEREQDKTVRIGTL
jgi:hypothetical protein